MMILPYAVAEEALREYHAQRLVRFMDAMPPASGDAPELKAAEFTQLVHELRP